MKNKFPHILSILLIAQSSFAQADYSKLYKQCLPYNLSEGKTALIFGTELNGLTKYALDNADGYLKIPMFGFTESFNISVSSAIFLYNLTTRLKISSIKWQLNEEDKNRIILSWLRNSIKDASLIEKKYFEMTNNKNTFFD